MTLIQNIGRAINQLRTDGWYNTLTGLGSAQGTNRYVKRSAGLASVYEFTGLYEQDWLAARIVDLLPGTALRKAPIIEGEDTADLWAEFKRLDTIRYPEGVFGRALCMGRLRGGHALLLGVSGRGPGAQLDQPLVIGSGTQLAWLEDVAAEWLTVVSRYQDPVSPKYRLPEVYQIGVGPRAGLRIHETKVILCEGHQLAPVGLGGDAAASIVSHIFEGWQGWDSVLSPVRETLEQDGMSWASISLLIKESSIGVLKMKGLIDMIARDEEAVTDARLRLLSRGKSVANTVFLDADKELEESFTRTDVKFSGVAPLIEMYMKRIAGAANIPATILFKQSPDGQNATGASDMRQWYDDVLAYANASVSPKLVRILSVIAGHEVFLKWPSYWEPTAAEAAALRKAQAESDKLYVDAGVVVAERVALSRAKDGTLGYELDEDDLAALKERAKDAEAAADEEPDPGILPGGAGGAAPPIESEEDL